MGFIKILRCSNFSGFIFSVIIKRGVQTLPATKTFPARSLILYNMRTAYFHNTEGEDKVFVTVRVAQDDFNKTFSFERKIAEPLNNFLSRLEGKLESTWLNKRIKKKKDLNNSFNDYETSLPMFKPQFFLNNKPLSSDMLFQNFFQINCDEDLKLRIIDVDYDVMINSPIIETVGLPKFLQVGFIISPEIASAKNTNIKDSEFIWFKSTEPQKSKNWEKCGEGFYYKIQPEDLGYFYKLLCIPKLNERAGPPVEVTSGTTVEQLNSLCEISKRHEYTKKKTGADEIRIVSYNILADLYLNTKEGKTELFSHCDPLYLEYSYRKPLLEFELQGYNADIFCFQEFEKKLYNNNLLLFNEWGYECVFNEKEGSREGSAILYDSSKFNFLSADQYKLSNEIFFNDLFSDIKIQIEKNQNLASRLVNIMSQLQVVVLECDKRNILVVGNVHFYFHPDADHIRLLQGIVALNLLLQTAQGVEKTHEGNKVSVLLCGDFNSTPECGIHQLLKEGSVGSDHFAWKNKESEIITDVSFSHPLKMKSAYEDIKFTNYVPNFKACIDYIYYQTNHLELKQTVPPPCEKTLNEFDGIPSKYFPSDHVALIADFKFKDNEIDK